MSQRSKVQPSSGKGGLSEFGRLWNSKTHAQGPTEGTSKLVGATSPKYQSNWIVRLLCSYLPCGHFGKDFWRKRVEGALRRRKEGRKDGKKSMRREGKEGANEEHRNNGIKLPVSGLVCKKLGSHHSHSYNKKSWTNGKLVTFLVSIRELRS